MGGAAKISFEPPANTTKKISNQIKTAAGAISHAAIQSKRNQKMQARFPPLELPRSGSQGSAVILTALSARLLRAPLRALTIQLLSVRF